MNNKQEMLPKSPRLKWGTMRITLCLLISFLFVSPGCSSHNNTAKMIDKTVVTTFDLQRYLGTWYEIARYDHKFERGLVGVTAHYSMRDDGKVKVVNKGYKGTLTGELSQAIGKGKVPDPENAPAKLKVSFFMFFYADYFVLDLDKDYQWAIVGSRSDHYLWILCRTPQMDPDLYESLLQKLEKRGYDGSKLIKVLQKE